MKYFTQVGKYSLMAYVINIKNLGRQRQESRRTNGCVFLLPCALRCRHGPLGKCVHCVPLEVRVRAA